MVILLTLNVPENDLELIYLCPFFCLAYKHPPDLSFVISEYSLKAKNSRNKYVRQNIENYINNECS